MDDNENEYDDYDVGGQVFGVSYSDYNRAQGAFGEEYTENPKTEEGKWNIKVRTLARIEGVKFEDVKDMANQIGKYLNLNPYTFVLAYKIVNLKGDKPINKEMLMKIKIKINTETTPIEKEPLSNIMTLSDVIRYAYLIRATSDRGRQVLV